MEQSAAACVMIGLRLQDVIGSGDGVVCSDGRFQPLNRGERALEVVDLYCHPRAKLIKY